MNVQELSEAFTDISDGLIEEAYDYQRASVFNFKKALSVAATAAVLIASVISVCIYGNRPDSTEPNGNVTASFDYTANTDVTNSVFDIVAPAVIPKEPKSIKNKTKNRIMKDYIIYSATDTDAEDFDIIYCGTYSGKVAFKVTLKDRQKGGEILSEKFADKNGEYGLLILNYRENEPVLIWSETEGISTLTQSYNSGAMNYEQIYSIWYWICIETGEF